MPKTLSLTSLLSQAGHGPRASAEVGVNQKAKALTEWATGLVVCALAALFEVSLLLVAKLPKRPFRRRR